MSDDTQSKTYKVTLKGGEGFAEPWVTIEGDTEAELAFALKDLLDKGTFALVGEAATGFRQGVHAVQTAAQTLGAQVQQGGNAQPAAAVQPQQGIAPQQTQAVQQYQQPAAQQQPQPWPTPAEQGPPPDFAQQGNVVQGNFGQLLQPQVQQQPAGNRVAPLENDYVGKGGHWPPAGPRPSCLHGPRDWKSFVSKAGKLTEMWACPFDRRGAFIPPGQTKCETEWAD